MKPNHSNKMQSLMLISILTMVVILNFDFTALNIILPNIISTLNTTLTTAQWTINIFTLTASSLFVLSGKALDYFRKERVYLVGGFVFFLATFMAVLSQNISILIVARAIQGLSFPFTFNGALLIIKSMGNKTDNPSKGISLIVASASITQGIAPIISGFLVQYFNWRSIFIIDLPLLFFCIIAGLLGAKSICEEPKEPEGRQNFLKSLWYIIPTILIPPICIFILNYLGEDHNLFYNPINTLIFCLCVISVIIILYKYRGLISENRVFIISLCVRFVFNICWAGLLFAIPVYLQNIKLIPVFSVGLIMLSMTAVTFFTSLFMANRIDEFSAKSALKYMLVTLILINIYSVFFSKNAIMLMPTLVGYGIATSFIIAITVKLAMNNIPQKILGTAMGCYYTASLLANSIGIFSAMIIINRTTGFLFPTGLLEAHPELGLFLNGSKPLSDLTMATLNQLSIQNKSITYLIASNYETAISLFMVLCTLATILALAAVSRLRQAE